MLLFWNIQKSSHEFQENETNPGCVANGVSKTYRKSTSDLFNYEIHKNDKSVDVSMHISKCLNLSDFLIFV